MLVIAFIVTRYVINGGDLGSIYAVAGPQHEPSKANAGVMLLYVLLSTTYLISYP